MPQLHTRFGTLTYDPSRHVLEFPRGLIGFPMCRRWLLLGDRHTDALAWLQSVDCPEVALAVVCPRRFVPDFQLRVSRQDLEPLAWTPSDPVQVLVILTRRGETLALNLKAPVVLSLRSGRGVQVIQSGQWPLAYPLALSRGRRCA